MIVSQQCLFPYVLILIACCGQNVIANRQTQQVVPQKRTIRYASKARKVACRCAAHILAPRCRKVTTYHRRHRLPGGQIQNPNADWRNDSRRHIRHHTEFHSQDHACYLSSLVGAHLRRSRTLRCLHRGLNLVRIRNLHNAIFAVLRLAVVASFLVSKHFKTKAHGGKITC
jgi:hypothetical protein